MRKIPLGLSMAMVAALQTAIATAGTPTPPPTAPAVATPAPTTPLPPPPPPPPPPPTVPLPAAPAPAYPPPYGYGYPASPPPPVWAVPHGPVVTIVTESSDVGVQQRWNLWQGVCLAPCIHALDANGIYRVAGRGLNPSDPFLLPRQDGYVVVQARMGSKAKRRIGFALGMAGLGVASFGGVLLLTNNSSGPDVPPSQVSDNSVTGTVAIVAGLLMSVVGLVMFSGNATSIDVH